MAHHLLNQKEEVFELLCQKLLKAQERMKVQADKHRKDEGTGRRQPLGNPIQSWGSNTLGPLK